ncbi:hypothetical protein Tco_0527414 [Tanacetum coccineum]
MTGTKVDIEKFDKKNDFELWQGKSRSEFINEFHKLVGDLVAIHTAISDDDQTFLLLTFLSSSYDNFVETLLYGRDTLKLEDMLATLNSRELQKMTEEKGDSGEGLYARRRSVQRDMEQGIITRNLKVLSRKKIRTIDWIMDLEGSYHITYMRDYLVDFKEYDSGNILLSDDRECHVRGREGFTVKILLGKIKVIKGSLMALSGIIRANCVCTLDGHAVTKKTLKGRKQLGHWVKDQNGNRVSMKVMLKEEEYFNTIVLEFNNTFVYVVISKWKAGLKMIWMFSQMCMCLATVERNVVTTAMSITESIHEDEIWATKGLLDKANGNVLGIDSVRDQSGNTLRVSQSIFYNEKLVQTLLEGHFILSLEGSLSRDCDVEKNGKWSCIYAVGIQEYQMVCTRLDIASADVEDRSLSWVDQSQAGYMTLTKATKEAIRLKGLTIKSGFKLKIVAGIAIGALSKAIPGPRFQHRLNLLSIGIG